MVFSSELNFTLIFSYFKKNKENTKQEDETVNLLT